MRSEGRKQRGYKICHCTSAHFGLRNLDLYSRRSVSSSSLGFTFFSKDSITLTPEEKGWMEKQRDREKIRGRDGEREREKMGGSMRRDNETRDRGERKEREE
jgi:hypothetical protein